MAATRRITMELGNLSKEPIKGVELQPAEDNIMLWKGTIEGPANTPYKGGTFHLSVTFPDNYPFKPPTIKFETRIFHPNFDEDGNICIGLLKPDAWKPATKMSQVLLAISNLLVEPNPDDPLVASIAEMYKMEPKQYEKTAKEYVKKYATAK